MAKALSRARFCAAPLALLALIALLALVAGGEVHAAQALPPAAGEKLKPFAVNIIRAQPQSWPGYGVYLGEGLVLTAAHVPGHARDGDPSVLIAGKTLPAKFVREGVFETLDLTLLRIDARSLPPSLGLRRMPVCVSPPRVGQAVLSVTPGAAVVSHVMSPKLLPADVRERFGTAISDVATTGNSGSGVFDPVSQCLMGIMSRKIQVSATRRKMPGAKPVLVDLAKYFVPARRIREFIKPN